MKSDKHEQWNKLYNDYLLSGLSCAMWCKLNNMKQHQFFYIRKQLGVVKPISKITQPSNMIFKQVSLSDDTNSFSFTINSINIEVKSNIDKKHLVLLIQDDCLL